MAIFCADHFNKVMTDEAAKLFAEGYIIEFIGNYGESLTFYNPKDKQHYYYCLYTTYKTRRVSSSDSTNSRTEYPVCAVIQLAKYNERYDARYNYRATVLNEQCFYKVFSNNKGTYYTDSVDELFKIIDLRIARAQLNCELSRCKTTMCDFTINHKKLKLTTQFKIMEHIHRQHGFKSAKFSDIEKIVMTKQGMHTRVAEIIVKDKNNSSSLIRMYCR